MLFVAIFSTQVDGCRRSVENALIINYVNKNQYADKIIDVSLVKTATVMVETTYSVKYILLYAYHVLNWFTQELTMRESIVLTVI